MDKPFKSYDEQIFKLKEKGMIIGNEEYAKTKLKEVGYYHLITGYKDLFKNKAVKKYKRGVKFEDIYALYNLDRNLRELFFKYLQIVERTFGSHISYYFCEKYGNDQNKYLDEGNYNTKSKRNLEIFISQLNKLVTKPNDYKNIMYYRKRYNNVPLWVLINAVTFGSKSKMYEFLLSDIQSKISHEYIGVTEDKLIQIMRFITKFRNICAHGGRLFNNKTNENMPDMIIHQKLNIPQKGKQYIYGKNDLFGVVVAFRYLLSKEDFKKFKKEIDLIITRFVKDNAFIDEKEILNQMGFPMNWKKISTFRKY